MNAGTGLPFPRTNRRTARRPNRVGIGPLMTGLGLATMAAIMAGRTLRKGTPPRPHPPASPRAHPDTAAEEARRRALRRSRDGAAILSFSVLADSGMEHYRGGYYHKTMYAAPVTAAVSMAANLAEPGGRGSGGGALSAVHLASAAVGLVGLRFHLHNLRSRDGGLNWNNLFYGAPLGAPGALVTAGMIGAVSHAMARADHDAPAALSRRHGRQLALLSTVALMGETAEVALLHFRGAFHNPAMFLPVTVPPLAAAGLAYHAWRPDPAHRPALRRGLQAVNALGLIGTGFHVLGVARNMGGWRNWSQTALQGPPVPAPISFTGLGLTGLAALDLLNVDEETPR